ncbi:Acyl-CoA oxidase/dehydrogenase, central domain protein [Tolypocladium paradoxum]|uniref:Acyl-CoA oxidase/dehydrogenase, central domain protein n=1 Tax=Tolypocladium paradoxum TaxID=94208 RepID=A0A2S4KTM4_9HYPO|nr:Acyl-CoA oxidase/dehydrogenase, central domain protein [Tolypocladium paradoxum]
MYAPFVERCGWQGLFAFNQISELALIFQGNSIAEGDTLVLCIRASRTSCILSLPTDLSLGLASEFLGNKYSIPEPEYPPTPLALHEQGLFREAKEMLIDIGGYERHRADTFNKQILPLCRNLVEAIGCRMAFEAARQYGVPSIVLRLYELLSMSADLSWYVENGITTRVEFARLLTSAYDAALPVLLALQEVDEANDFATAPIMTEKAWSKFMCTLPRFESHRKRLAGSSKL